MANKILSKKHTACSMSNEARVLRIDFSSLADPKPYWVQVGMIWTAKDGSAGMVIEL